MIGIVQLLIVFPLLILRGGAIHLVWGWFVVPLGVRPLSLYEAAGLIFVASLFKNTPDDKEDPHADPWVVLLTQVFKSLIIIAATLLFAWIWHTVGIHS